MISLVKYLLESKKNEVKYNGFAILKPEFLDKQDEFEQKLEDNGWKISDLTKIKLSLDDAKNLYSCHKNEDFYDDLCKYMSSDKCIAYKLYKDCKDPIKDLEKLKDSIRDEWGKDDMKNCMHSSDSKENVKRESEICFNINYKEE